MRLVYVLVAIRIVAQVFAAFLGYVEVPLWRSADSMYYIKSISVGKLKQQMNNVILDTGSADLVLTDSTYKVHGQRVGPQYISQYGSSEPFSMFQHHDSISGPGWTLQKATLGVADNVTEIDTFYGVFGVGYPSIEAMDPYANFPMKLESQGLTASQVYSISGATEPEIVFGGIDTGAYNGPLIRTPIGLEVGPHTTRQYYTVTAVTINLVSVIYDGPHRHRLSKPHSTPISTQKLLYTLDTGANILMVPEPIYANLMTAIHAKKYWHGSTAYYHRPSLDGIGLEFNITGFIVSVPLSDLVGECMAVRGGEYCTLNVGTIAIGVDSYVATLPNCVFRYIYTVFDLAANYVYMAPYLGGSSRSLCLVSGTTMPVSTTTAPAYTDVYTVMYNTANETTITRASATARCRR